MLDMLLGCQDPIVGLGEVDMLTNTERRQEFLARYESTRCSCGELTSECPIWGRYKQILDDHGDLPYSELYGRLLGIAGEHTGRSFFSDSSKHLRALERVVAALPKIGVDPADFYVVHLVKDVRSFTVSNMRKRSVQNPSIRKSFGNWKRVNLALETFIEERGLKRITVGYEEVALGTAEALERMLAFLGLGESEVVTDLSRSHAHIGFGNSMRNDPEKSQRVSYDQRWFVADAVSRAYAFAPGIQKLNRRWVYGHLEAAGK